MSVQERTPTVVDALAERRERRERVAVGVVNTVMDSYIAAGIPPQFFPSVEHFKTLIAEVWHLLDKEGF